MLFLSGFELYSRWVPLKKVPAGCKEDRVGQNCFEN